MTERDKDELHEPDERRDRASTWAWTIATGEVTWSEGIEEVLFGLPRGTFAGTFEAYLALVHSDDRAYFQAVIARTLGGVDEYIISHRVVWPDGSIHWIDGRGHLTRDEHGQPLVLTGVVWNNVLRRQASSKITHLRRVEAVASAVRRQLLRVKTETEVFDLACAIAVEHGHFRFAWIGLAKDHARILPVARAGFEDGYLGEGAIVVGLTSEAHGPMARAFRSGAPQVVNDTARDESFAPYRVAALARGYRTCGAFPLRRGGAVVGVMVIYAGEANRFDDDHIALFAGLADDIAFKLDAIEAEEKRVRAEEAMKQSEERYRALVEEATEAIFVSSREGVISEVNPASREMTGYTREELIGREMRILFDPTDTRPRSLLGHAPGERVSAERRLRRKDGTLIECEVNGIVLADGRILGYARDVTARNSLQQKLILADRLTSLGRLAAGVAHEINNPLTYVALNLERIERIAAAQSPVNESLVEILAATTDARDGAERVRAVVRSLGAFSREDEGAVGAVDLHRVLDSAIRLSENKIRHRGRIVKKYDARRSARGNELRLGQVFVNLLVNAADALREDTPERNEVCVRTLDDGDRVVVEVSDNGVGIPSEIMGRIFDPFFTTKAVGEGTGLGLSISHGIVSAFGGQVNVESKAGLGTTFRVSLIAESATDETSVVGSEKESRARIKLLIIDDERRLGEGLGALLDHHAVTVVESGRQALALLQAQTYDAILCDLMMPDLSGMDLHAELVRMGKRQDRRMIFMTGGTFTARARDFISQTENAVLEKPFSPDDADAAIKMLIEREGKVAIETASALQSSSIDD